jgi:hypothetical protein
VGGFYTVGEIYPVVEKNLGFYRNSVTNASSCIDRRIEVLTQPVVTSPGPLSFEERGPGEVIPGKAVIHKVIYAPVQNMLFAPQAGIILMTLDHIAENLAGDILS